MENNLIQDGQIRQNYAKAVKLHSEIMVNGAIAVQALANMCTEIKQMRDEQLYAELGYDTFDDYVEKAMGIKKRQAYNYIRILEEHGSTFLQANAQLGITKLALLTDVPAIERADFVEENDLESMSTREMKELIEQLKQEVSHAGEQISLLTTENSQPKIGSHAADDAEELAREASREAEAKQQEAERQLKEAQDRIAELEKAEPDAETLEKIRKDAEKEAKKGIKDKLKDEVQKARAAAIKEMDERLETAKKEARAAGAEEAKKGLADIEQEKAAAIARAQELEKKLAIASNKETVLFAHLFEEMQGNFNRAIGCVEKISQSDTETAAKLRGALKKCLEMMEGKADEKADNQYG